MLSIVAACGNKTKDKPQPPADPVAALTAFKPLIDETLDVSAAIEVGRKYEDMDIDAIKSDLAGCVPSTWDERDKAKLDAAAAAIAAIDDPKYAAAVKAAVAYWETMQSLVEKKQSLCEIVKRDGPSEPSAT